MTGKSANIYFSEKTYDRLRQVAGPKISRFVNEAVEEKLQKKIQEQKGELRQKLIAGYQANVKNKELQKELEIYDEAIADGLSDEKK